MKKFLILMLFVSFVTFAQQKEITHKLKEIVVTANKYATPVSRVASSVTIITAAEIEMKQKSTVVEVLRDVPGLAVVEQGGPGKLTSVFMRGANSNFVLVLIDGVEVNNPASPNNGFDFSTLQISDIEKIEIVRGPQSTLYGSEAIAGVINIITKKGSGKPSFTFSGEGGSHAFLKGSVSSAGSLGKFNYAVNFSRLQTEGISAIKGDNFENDGYANNSIFAKLGYDFSGNLNFNLMYKQIDAAGDIDQAQKNGDDPNYTFDSKTRLINGKINGSFLNGKLQSSIRTSYFTFSGNTNDKEDAAHPGIKSDSKFDGRRLSLDFQNNLVIGKSNIFTLGLDYRSDKASSSYYSESSFGSYQSEFPEESIGTFGVYLQDQVNYAGNFFASVGIRYDNNNKFGSVFTYRIAPAYLIRHSGTKLKASFGTGFKAPSVMNLFDPVYGNPDLSPEKSSGWEAGIEQSFLKGNLQFGLTYFNFKITDMIGFDSNFKPVNINKAESKGIEAGLTLQNISGFSFNTTYTYNKVNDVSESNPNKEDQLIRRPEHKLVVNANYNYNGKLNINLSANMNGKRYDNDYSVWPAKRVVLDSYTLLNLAVSYKIFDYLTVTGKVENLLDTEYEEVLYYGTLGRSFYGGLKLEL